MTKKIDEMDGVTYSGSERHFTPTATATSAETNPLDIETIEPISSSPACTVYADKIITCNSTDEGPISYFDISFFVSMTDPETGGSNTYQVIKRIGIDKAKIAADALNSVKVSIVESKQEEKSRWSMDDIVRIARIKG